MGCFKSLVRRYLAQNRIPKAKCNDGIWSIPESAKKPQKLPNTPIETEELSTLASKLVNQKKKRNYHGLYDYVVINLTYSSCRMASNRLTRGHEFGVAFAIAAILMVLTVLINFAATLVQKHFAKRRSL